MRLLLLGCTGFIGKELIEKLLKNNYEICVVSRKNIDKLGNSIPLDKINFLKLDLSFKNNWVNPNLLEKLKQSDGIINLVGEPIANKKWTIKQKEEITNSRIKTTSFLIETLKNYKINPKVIISGSAIGFYGTSLIKEFNESSSAGDDFLANLCKKWEDSISNKPLFTRLVILRIGIVIESDGGALGKILPIYKAGLGGPIGEGRQWMSWIHRTDLCNIILCALKNKRYSGVFNAVAPKPVLMKDFSKILANCLNKPNLLPVPGFVLKALLGEGAKLVLEGQKVSSVKLANRKFKFKYPLLEEAIFASTKK